MKHIEIPAEASVTVEGRERVISGESFSGLPGFRVTRHFWYLTINGKSYEFELTAESTDRGEVGIDCETLEPVTAHLHDWIRGCLEGFHE